MLTLLALAVAVWLLWIKYRPWTDYERMLISRQTSRAKREAAERDRIKRENWFYD